MPDGMKRTGRLSQGMATFVAIVVVATVIPGCIHRRPRPREISAGLWRDMPLGEIISVNRSLNYVILKCIVLPSPGEILKVYHGPVAVAELEIERVAAGSCAAARILKGYPIKGDLVRRGQPGSDATDESGSMADGRQTRNRRAGSGAGGTPVALRGQTAP